MTTSPPSPGWSADDLLEAVSTVFESLGRGMICLDRDFRVVHGSSSLEHLVGPGAAAAARGKPAEELLDADLFGAAGSLRRALEAGERREGWGATLRIGDLEPMSVSLTAAPVIHRPGAPCDPRVAHIVVFRPVEGEESGLTERPTLFAGMIARSPAMLRIFSLIEHLRESDATVLVTGESGTGKELVARAIHLHSPRRNGPFVAVNCGALPPDLLESELFGHVRGAFTGAVRDRVGRFEAADGGTIFLDEVGEIALPLQVKLLRVLQERTFERVGQTATRSSDARVIAATNRDLHAAVAAGTFRDDLYYRLRVVPIHVPPLAERREDIEPLARHLLARVGRRHGRSVRFSPDALRVLLQHTWPGNVRELENALEYALAVGDGQTLMPRDLPSELQRGEAGGRSSTRAGARPAGQAAGPPPPAPSGDPEEERIRRALDAHRWRREETAEALGISRTTLWRKMRELGLLE